MEKVTNEQVDLKKFVSLDSSKYVLRMLLNPKEQPVTAIDVPTFACSP